MFLTTAFSSVVGVLSRYSTTILITMLGATTLWVAAQRYTINNLHEEIGVYKQGITELAAANIYQQNQIQKAVGLLRKCVDMRKAADENLRVKAAELEYEKQRAQDLTEEHANEINQIVQDQKSEVVSSAKDCTPAALPPRASELLVEAATSANRGSRSP